MTYLGGRTINAADYDYAYGGYNALPLDVDGVARHYGGLAVPFRLYVKLDWVLNGPQPPPYDTITPTPIALWATAHALDKEGAYYNEPWEIVPGRKTWPTLKFGTTCLEYRADSIEPDERYYTDYIDILWRVRSIYHSPALAADMPDLYIFAELQYCDS